MIETRTVESFDIIRIVLHLNTEYTGYMAIQEYMSKKQKQEQSGKALKMLNFKKEARTLAKCCFCQLFHELRMVGN